MAENFKNFIAGDWVAPSTGAYFENRNPADWTDVIGCFPRSGADDVARAIAAARRGFAAWSQTPAPIRGQGVQRGGERLTRRQDEIAKGMTRGGGKGPTGTGGDAPGGSGPAFSAARGGRRR